MTLKSVYDFLNDEIDNISKNISKLEEEIKVKNISIEEAKVFLKEINGEDSDESLFSPLYLEQKKNENLSREEETIERCSKEIRALSSQLSEYLTKKDNLKNQIAIIEKFTKTGTVIPHETLDLLKENNDYVTNEMNSLLKKFNKCLESFIYVDPKRVIIEYKSFQDRVESLKTRLDKNNQLIEKLSKA